MSALLNSNAMAALNLDGLWKAPTKLGWLSWVPKFWKTLKASYSTILLFSNGKGFQNSGRPLRHLIRQTFPAMAVFTAQLTKLIKKASFYTFTYSPFVVYHVTSSSHYSKHKKV